MAGPIMPDYGGAWIHDTGGGGGEGSPPDGLLDLLGKFGEKWNSVQWYCDLDSISD